MASYDLSRSSTDYRKRYTGVRMQQGRVIIDDDWNENERLHKRDRRRTGVDVIGSAGSPDSGFLISNPTINNNISDFTIEKGTFYLGGYRLELTDSETYQNQTDWLQKARDENPGIPVNNQRDLVYLELWEQPVTAVEDSELLEPALGGPDTSVRMRLMHRVHVESGVPVSKCHEAWQNLQYRWTKYSKGVLNPQQRLVPTVKLTVGFKDTGTSSDLCNPSTVGGYLGAENQAIRVQLVDSNHFTWGLDNATPLYRVKLASSDRKVLEMQTQPKDQAHWPLAGQVVEILPWSALLPNNEAVSEIGGFLTTVASSYSPNSPNEHQFTLFSPVPANLDKYNTTTTPFLFMRLWNRGGDITSPAAIPFLDGQTVDLGYTGLKITIKGTDCVPGDFWIIAARPETPKQVLPWRLTSGISPDGIRRYYAPLAVIYWQIQGTNVGNSVLTDCRYHFPPLTHITADDVSYHNSVYQTEDETTVKDALDDLYQRGQGACTLVVSPGPGWEKILDKIAVNQDAQICFKVGDFPIEKTVTLKNKGRLKLTGCGPGTRILAPKAEAALHFDTCASVTVRDLYGESGVSGSGNVLTYLNGTFTFSKCAEVLMENVALSCAAAARQGASCITVRDANAYDRRSRPVVAPVTSARIRDCSLSVGDNQTGMLLVNVARAFVEDNILKFRADGNKPTLIEMLKNARFRKQIRRLLVSNATTGRFKKKQDKPVPSGKFNAIVEYNKMYVLFATAKELSDKYKVWQKVVDDNPPARVESELELQRYLDDLAEQILVNAKVRKSHKALQAWFNALQKKAVSVAQQGIIVAGQVAAEARILNNSLDGFLQGIHVGVSHRETQKGTADKAGFVTISGNTIRARTTAHKRQEICEGIFVGNCESLMMENNYVDLAFSSGMKIDEFFGIKVYGHLGPRLIVRHNHIATFQRGIYIGWESVPGVRLWLAADNIATSANVAVESGKNYLERNDAGSDENVLPQ